MKITKSKLKQIIKEELSKVLNEEEPSVSISPGHIQTPPDVIATRGEGHLQDIINDYVAMVADTPDEMRQALENIATALKNKETLRPELAPAALSAYAHNLLPDAVEKMKGAIGH